MDTHFQAVGWLMIASSVFTGVGAIALFAAGWFIQGTPFRIPPALIGPDSEILIAAIVSGLGLLLAVTTALSIVAGIGILQYQEWGRVVALIAASLMLTKFPIGTAVGVYTFWVLLSVEGRAHFRARTVQTAAGSAA